MRTWKFGLIGGAAGSFIGDIHRRAAEFDGLGELVAGCFSRDYEKSLAFGRANGICRERIYPSYDEMARAEALREDPVDFVIVAAPNDVHYPCCRAFLEQGIPVVCDKPLTINSRQAQKLAELRAERGLPFAVTYPYAAMPAAAYMRQQIREGLLGKLLLVKAEYLSDNLLAPNDALDSGMRWRIDPDRAGASTCCGDIGVHAQHLVSYVTGLRMEELSADMNVIGEDRCLDTNFTATVRYEGGVKGHFWCSNVAAGKYNDLNIAVYGTRGSLTWSLENPDIVIFAAPGRSIQYRMGRSEALGACSSQFRLPAGQGEGYYLAFANIYRSFMQDLLRRSEGQPLEGGYPGIEDGLESLFFVEGCLASSADGGAWKKLDSLREHGLLREHDLPNNPRKNLSDLPRKDPAGPGKEVNADPRKKDPSDAEATPAQRVYEKFLARSSRDDEFRDWQVYREELTDFILSGTAPGGSMLILGAGKCNDLDLGKLREHAGTIVLSDHRRELADQAAGQYGLKLDDRLRFEQKDYVGIPEEDYLEYTRLLLKVMEKLAGPNQFAGPHGAEEAGPHQIADKHEAEETGPNQFTEQHEGEELSLDRLAGPQLQALQEALEDIYRRNEAAGLDLGTRAYDSVVVCGVHSQLNNAFRGIFQFARKDTEERLGEVKFAEELNAAVFETTRRHTEAIVRRFNEALFRAARETIIYGFEEHMIYTPAGKEHPVMGTVDGARQAGEAIQDYPARNRLETTWPLSRRRGVMFDMIICQLHREDDPSR